MRGGTSRVYPYDLVRWR